MRERSTVPRVEQPRRALLCPDRTIGLLVIEGHGEASSRGSCKLDLEGIVGKYDESPYQRGKRPTWVKIKNSGYSRREAIEGFR